MEEKKAKAQAAETAAAGTKTKHSIEMLRKHCLKLFGVNQSTFDGAAHGLSDGELTVEEMANRIKGWQDMPVASASDKTVKEEK